MNCIAEMKDEGKVGVNREEGGNKKGDKHNDENYRPISLTSVTRKILDHTVCRNLINHFEKHHALYHPRPWLQSRLLLWDWDPAPHYNTWPTSLFGQKKTSGCCHPGLFKGIQHHSPPTPASQASWVRNPRPPPYLDHKFPNAAEDESRDRRYLIKWDNGWFQRPRRNSPRPAHLRLPHQQPYWQSKVHSSSLCWQLPPISHTGDYTHIIQNPWQCHRDTAYDQSADTPGKKAPTPPDFNLQGGWGVGTGCTIFWLHLRHKPGRLIKGKAKTFSDCVMSWTFQAPRSDVTLTNWGTLSLSWWLVTFLFVSLLNV